MYRAAHIVSRPIRFPVLFLRRLAHGCIPSHLRLPLRFWWARCKQALEPELIFLSKQNWRSGIAVDVGAGHGVYSYALARVFDRVEAFEPNTTNAADLYGMRSDKIMIHSEALSDHEAESTLYSPISSSGVEYSGWGSLNLQMLPPASAVRSRIVRTRSLDSYHLENVAFIKTDVEGHEISVLEGAIETIARWRPMILTEVKPVSRTSVWDFFTGRQYRCFFLESNRLCPVTLMAGFATNSGENFFWLPEESVRTSQKPGVGER
jgi:FkbM family methyltransferase